MKETGRVIEITGDTAAVAFERKKSCEKCGMCLASGSDMVSTARNDARANVGDTVEVQMEDGAFLSAAFILYIVPLLCLLAGILAANALKAPEIVQFACGLGAACIAFFIIRATENRRKKNARYNPVITAIVPAQNEAD